MVMVALTARGEAFLSHLEKGGRRYSYDFCETCGFDVPEGTEHNHEAHKASYGRAEELRRWKWALKMTSAAH